MRELAQRGHSLGVEAPGWGPALGPCSAPRGTCPADQMLLAVCERALKGACVGQAVLRCDWIMPTTLPPWKDERGIMLGM